MVSMEYHGPIAPNGLDIVLIGTAQVKERSIGTGAIWKIDINDAGGPRTDHGT